MVPALVVKFPSTLIPSKRIDHLPIPLLSEPIGFIGKGWVIFELEFLSE